MANTVLLLKNKTVPVDPYEVKFNSSNNFIPKFIPLLKHEQLNKLKILSYLTSTDFIQNVEFFIITSQRAIESLNNCIDSINSNDLKSLIYNKKCYTVGPATFKILSDSGFKNVKGGELAGNGLILADLIISDYYSNQNDISDININCIFFTGEIRKDTLPKKLINSGFNLTEKIVYKTCPMNDIVERYNNNFNELSNSDINWLVFFSPQGTESIVNHLKLNNNNNNNNNISLKNIKIASIGPTTESYLLQNNITPHVVAKKPDADSLFDSILNHH
ncbi:lyase activity protein [[Candida] boidinii]|uniref:Unnamed protein product n=1 Tax=Candida boidinii TaxID=5477 RepID=A0ACB5TUS4_CANBO|nr:lyase activity protein [[Candida] boidinii]OWB74363.1 lyase activity protein [[Candida] boidinii]OWB80443.1 lyase activity protein [[Candida] boidinii]GME95855.1 unnamed protein product [[Candida] boidinii]GMF13859.1 unnamed protein product [[Candida] boidinii]